MTTTQTAPAASPALTARRLAQVEPLELRTLTDDQLEDLGNEMNAVMDAADTATGPRAHQYQGNGQRAARITARIIREYSHRA